MENRYLIDTSAWIEYFSGTALGEKAREIIEKEATSTCMLSIAEISGKFSKEKKKFDKALAFIKNRSSIVRITMAICEESGKLKAERRKTKKDFGIADAIIYLAAKENSCMLVAIDDDFEGMENAMVLAKS